MTDQLHIISLIDALVFSGLSDSKSAAKRDIISGGIYVNNVKNTEIDRYLAVEFDALFEKYILLRKGKRNYVVLHII